MSLANDIELITKYSVEKFDEAYYVGACTAILDGPTNQLKWTGSRTLMIPKIAFSALKNYTRNNNQTGASDAPFGYKYGNAKAEWESFTVEYDRAIVYPIDKADDEESAGIIMAHAVRTINKTVIIPEIDACRFSKLASYCSDNLGNLVTESESTLTKENIYDKLIDGFEYLTSHEVALENQVVFVSTHVASLLQRANVAMSRLIMTDFSGKYEFSTQSLEGRNLIVVPPNRFKTEYECTDDGYVYGEGSKGIDYLMVDKTACWAIKKYEKLVILTGAAVLAGSNFDGSKIYFHIYHDIFVPDNARIAIYTHVGSTTAPEASLDVRMDKKGIVKGITLFPSGKVASYAVSSTEQTVGSSVSGTVTYISTGYDLSAGGYVIAIVDGKVFAQTHYDAVN